MEVIQQKSTRHRQKEFSSHEKFDMLLKGSQLQAEELSADGRTQGIYPEDLEIWRQAMLSNLEPQAKHALVKENNTLKVKIRELKLELNCKDKAWAETSALLVLKQKAKIIWEGQRTKNSWSE